MDVNKIKKINNDTHLYDMHIYAVLTCKVIYFDIYIERERESMRRTPFF